MPDATPNVAPPKRRWYQYSLRTMFVVITLICVAMGLYVGPKVRRHNIVLAIEAVGGHVVYEDSAADESWPSKLLREHVPRDWCDEVKVVDLDGPVAGDATLAGFETLSGLQRLWLGNTQITDAGLVHLQGLSGLQRLSLGGTHVTDAGLVHLEGLTGLQVLGLDGTQLTDAGLVDLKKSLPNCDIR